MKERISIKSAIILTVIILPLAVAISGFMKGNESVKLSFLEMIGGGIQDTGESGSVDESSVGGDSGGVSGNQENVSTATSEIDTLPRSCVIVDLSGEIESPGVYMLQEGSRIFDAIEAAGGLTKNADINYINRAEILFDEMKIYIPSKDDASGFQQSATSGGRSSTASAYSSLININTATSEVLQTIPGIGPSTAEKIIAYRATHGKFSSIEELINISGIGAKTLEKMKGYITAR